MPPKKNSSKDADADISSEKTEAPSEEKAPPPVPDEEVTRKTTISEQIASGLKTTVVSGLKFLGAKPSEDSAPAAPAAEAAEPAPAEPPPPAPKRAPFGGEIIDEPTADGWIRVAIGSHRIRKLAGNGQCRNIGTDGPDGTYNSCEIPVSGLE